MQRFGDTSIRTVLRVPVPLRDKVSGQARREKRYIMDVLTQAMDEYIDRHKVPGPVKPSE